MKKLKVLTSYLAVVVAALGISVAFIAVFGSDIGQALAGFIGGISSSSYAVSEVLVKAVPLTLCGLGIAVGFRSGFINLGAEGQLYMGAAAATSVGLLFPGLPKFVLLPLMILAAFVAGGLWSLVPGFLKARFGISEIIVTIMFNYIAINIVGILVRGPLKDPDYAYPVSTPLPEAGLLSPLFPPGRLHQGLFIALAAALIIYILVWKTPMGYQLRAVGQNARASHCAGISIYKNVIIAAMISGGLAGLAGMGEVAGLHGKLLEGISPEYGYVAIIVALLGKNHPLGVLIAALGLGALQVGSLAMQRSAGVPTSISSIIMGLIVLLILARHSVFSKWIEKKKES